ncbi:acyl-CoA dehydrogenase family protein [Vibrio spartinae]|uniref:Acyl-CoA dehydrogenase n=1 Tax=Vibrio spartinae TaxID=1918945 RepID=A0A1N6M574_9VIBR|nr:acyl-CoA dehydrogenase family protein [Vibrio spartinae]SIO94599.1 Acyl-CoA dehydrogenase [Vibrio spartinae]
MKFDNRLSAEGQAIRDYVTATLEEGRILGRLIDEDPDNYRVTAHYSLAQQMNRLGLPEVYNPTPIELANGQVLHELTVVQRCLFYEALGYVEPNLIFACPTPGMAGFVLQGLGNPEQQARFFSLFRDQLSWSCFAMSEPTVGSDAGNIKTQATKVDGGYLINGEKYFIGNGIHADIGVVFARTNQNSLGTDVFLFEPAEVEGFCRKRLPVHGVPGCNVSHLVFEDMFVADDALLGAHLKPTQRFSGAAIATFDSLRPCVGALALGSARAMLDYVLQHELIDAVYHQTWLKSAQFRLAGALQNLLAISARYDRGETVTKQIGLAKAKAAEIAELVVEEALHRCHSGVLVQDQMLAKLHRDIKCFEYAEGTRNVHLLNGAMLFREVA